MDGEEAFGTWQRDQLGQPVDQDQQAEINTCQEVCARAVPPLTSIC